MNKILNALLLLWTTYSFALPEEDTINFNLSNQIKGTCPDILRNAPATVTYHYDFKKNMGLATLTELNGIRLDEFLYPLGLSRMYAFMSDMPPKSVTFDDGSTAVIYRIIFQLHKDGTTKLMMMINQDGSCILES